MAAAATCIYLFGFPCLVSDDQPVRLASAPTTNLLSYLALYATHRRPVARSRLIGALWPNHTETRARRELTKALYDLRRRINHADWLHSNEETLALGEVWVDVEQFRRLASSPSPSDRYSALELYTGDLLEHLDADWVQGQRATLRNLYLATLEQTCRELSDTAHLAEALSLAQRWTLADPFHEEAHIAVMRLHARSGHYAAALQQYDYLRHLLADELHSEPLQETQALAASIRTAYHPQQERRSPLPLIGRRQERATLLRLDDMAHNGRGRLVLVEGEAGIGRTRLLEALAEGVTWRGGAVAWGRAQNTPDTPPAMPLDAALRAVLAGPHGVQLQTRLSSSSTQALAGLLPQLAPADNRLSRSPATNGDLQHPPPARLGLPAAMADMLQTLAEISPYTLLLDDVQWAEASFWDALAAIAPLLPRLRLLIVLSYRGDDIRARPAAWRGLRDLDAEVAPVRVPLGGFSVEECAELAWAQDIRLSEDAAHELCQRAGGNPLFVHELLRAPANERESPALRAIMGQRLARLPNPARAALEAAATLGPSFDLHSWTSVARQPVGEVAGLLVAAYLLEQTKQGYRFIHGLTREYLARTTPTDRLRELQRRAAEIQLGQEGSAPVRTLAMARPRMGPKRRAPLAVIDTAGNHQPEHTHQPQDQLPFHKDDQAITIPPPVIVQLARVETPLGRRLTDADRVEVRWTIDGGLADQATLETQGKVALRRQRLCRLLAEARAQHAAPTDADLASALGVTERTIENDLAALQASGLLVSTRRRRPH